MVIPSELITGESKIWDDDATSDTLGNPVTSTDWVLKYQLRGPVNLTLTASANGSGWRTTLSVIDSSTLTPGTYYWQAVLTKGSPTVTDRILKNAGKFIVKQALADLTLGGYDGRSQAQKDLDGVQAAMRAIISGGAVQEYSIGGRSVRKMLMNDLITLESRLKAQVAAEGAAESIATGKGNPRTLWVRFNKR